MSEHPMMAFMLRMSNIMGGLEEMEENIKPLPSQYEMGPGTKGLIATGSSQMEHDLVIVEVLDPEAFKEDFPDWEDRLMKSYLLCRWRSVQDHEGDVGWFSRVRIIPLKDEYYGELAGWMDTQEYPEHLPDWVNEVYTEYTDQIHEQAPDKIPSAYRCEKCGDNNTELHLRQMTKIGARAGVIEHEGKTLYTVISDQSHDHQQAAHLHCKNEACGYRKHIENEDWHIPS